MDENSPTTMLRRVTASAPASSAWRSVSESSCSAIPSSCMVHSCDYVRGDHSALRGRLQAPASRTLTLFVISVAYAAGNKTSPDRVGQECLQAGGPRFEPRLMDPESTVLPIRLSPNAGHIVTRVFHLRNDLVDVSNCIFMRRGKNWSGCAEQGEPGHHG